MMVSWRIFLMIVYPLVGAINCHDANTYCSNSWSHLPFSCQPDLSILPDVYSYCSLNDQILWRMGVKNTASTAPDPLIDYTFIMCLQSAAAQRLCNQTITPSGTVTYDMSVKDINESANRVQMWYDDQRNKSNTLAFTELQIGIRTVLTSIHRRWGYYSEYQSFWNYVISNDFPSAISKLRAWYSNGATDETLSKEANIIEASISCRWSRMDCVFLLDSSYHGNMYFEQQNFETAVNWILSFITSFDGSFGWEGVRFGLSRYYDDLYTDFWLTDCLDLDCYKRELYYTAINYRYNRNGLQNLGWALFQTKRSQLYKLRSGIPRVLIVMTDGRVTDSLSSGFRSIQNLNLTIIGIGIRNYDMKQVKNLNITSDDNVYALDSISNINSRDILSGIVEQTCYETTQLQLHDDNPVRFGDMESFKGQTLYFEFITDQQNGLNFDRNILLNITQTLGCVYLYISYCTQYPSYFMNDINFTSCEQSIKEVVLAPMSQCGLNQTQSTMVYIALEGRSDDNTNTFDMVIDVCNNTVCNVGTNYDPELNIDHPYSIDEILDKHWNPATTFMNTDNITTSDNGVRQYVAEKDTTDGLSSFQIGIIIAILIILVIVATALFIKYKMNKVNHTTYNKKVPIEDEEDNDNATGEEADDETTLITS